VVQLSADDVGQSDASRITLITYFTDPLCSWSWAFEPVRQQVQQYCADAVRWRYCLGGLIPDWQSFRDPMNAVHKPAQLAPAWYHVGQTTGVALDPSIWQQDPPASSYPACIAVKAAALQGEEHEARYLQAVRAAVMTQRRNVARTDVLLGIAEEIADGGGFDPRQFAEDLRGEPARTAFAADLRECQSRQVGRFPSFVLRGPVCSRIVVGYRPFDLFLQVLHAAGMEVARLEQ
jgi:putative protein-disulfide isomerase